MLFEIRKFEKETIDLMPIFSQDAQADLSNLKVLRTMQRRLSSKNIMKQPTNQKHHNLNADFGSDNSDTEN